MYRFLSCLFWAGLTATLTSFAGESPIQYSFSGATVEENKVSLQGAGFGTYPQARVTFGYIPTDNAFEGATDGQGAIVIAQPGEGVMVFGSRIESQDAAVIRCSVRTDRPNAQVILAAIGGAPDIFIATNSPFSQAYFQGQYRRIGVFVTPPTNGFMPVLQILNTSSTESLTAYVDNLEIVSLKRFTAYHGEFLNCNEIDPPADALQKEVSGSEAGIFGPWKTAFRQNPPMQQTGVSIDNFIRLNFSEKTASANGVSLQGAGFGAYPQASVSFTYIPTDNAYDGATDGQGIIIEAKPGEGVMIFGPSITTREAAMVRCNVRTESNDAEIIIATIGAEPDRFISTNTPTNYRYFEGQYKRISTFAAPSSGGFIPVIQVINPHETETLIVYLDNFDIVILDKYNYYYGEFLNGDETDPANGKIGFPTESGLFVE